MLERKIRLQIGLDEFLRDLQNKSIEKKIVEQQLLIVKNALLTDDEYLRIARTFGEIELPSHQNRFHHLDEILIVTGSSTTGKCWHTDYAFWAEPPRFTFLLCKKSPAIAGETLFIDTHETYNKLSEPYKNKINKLKGIYSFKSVYAKKLKQKGLELTKRQFKYPDVEHEIVKTHPITKRKAIHLHEEYLLSISDYSSEESKNIIDDLYNTVLTSENTFVHNWNVNDLAIWDNRSMLHKGLSCPQPHSRELYRIVVK
ncbi:MAG: TauD/TfdA family dioxygenase [Chloroflexi bacterium]|nr:TauD/TfdA family dioxygenase [Chloroflexota bacterium]